MSPASPTLNLFLSALLSPLSPLSPASPISQKLSHPLPHSPSTTTTTLPSNPLPNSTSNTMTAEGMVGLLTRHPSLTHDQFSDYWLHHHAAVGIPWALANHCVSYVQIHDPTFSAAARAHPPDWDMAAYDGAAELTFAPPAGFEETAKSKDFFQKVLVPDEKRFLKGEARAIARFVDAGLVEGKRIVLVEGGKLKVGDDGKSVVDMTEAFRVWDQWVVEGEEQTKEE